MQSLSSPRKLPELAEHMSAAEYVHRATKMHEAQIPRNWFDRNVYPIVSWIGDAMLAVPPINRLSSALGLSLGLAAGASTARLLAGRRFDGVETQKPDNFLGKVHGVMGFNKFDNDLATRAKKVVMYLIFSVGGAIGVSIGTKLAYRSTYKKNRNPEFLEDYDARISQEQADRWTPLTALSAIFGSSSGFAMLPVPGLNYAVSLSSRTVLMQNRNNMTPGLHKWISGTKTYSTLSIREGLQDLIQYAVHNPAETPALLELKSFHLLTQLFPDAKAEHIRQFVDKIHELRDPYLTPGGVPKEKQAELETKLTERFMKAGFETTLVEIGLNPRAVRFTQMNGALGRVANRLGAKGKVESLQREYDAKLLSRHPDLPQNGHFLPAKPAEVAVMQEETVPNTVAYSERAEGQKKEIEPRAASYQDQRVQEKTADSKISVTV